MREWKLGISIHLSFIGKNTVCSHPWAGRESVGSRSVWSHGRFLQQHLSEWAILVTGCNLEADCKR